MAKAKKSSTANAGARRGSGELRIIGGQWRGRKLRFEAGDGLRPTGDRIRETLFNWLAPDINGARCLDLFAGSGALGLEALSRGAADCDFVDSASAVARQLQSHLDTLRASERARVHAADATAFLERDTGPWDIVFIDPPFGRELVSATLQQLRPAQLAPDALVYIESARDEAMPAVPDNWLLHRDKHAGAVAYRLYAVGAG